MFAFIPIFLSTPNALSPAQMASKAHIMRLIEGEGLLPRTVGTSDVPSQFPLKEAAILARACYGGVILGFEQGYAAVYQSKRGTKATREEPDKRFATPWNNIESGMLFALRKPILVFRQKDISGGIFDHGVSDVFVHELPDAELTEAELSPIARVIKQWSSEVVSAYRKWG